MITNSLNPLSDHFRGRKLPEFVDSHYIDREHSSRHAFLLHTHPDKAELYFVCTGSTRYMVDDHFYNLSAGDIVICSQNVMHGESFMDTHDDSSISVGIRNLYLEDLPENVLCGQDIMPVIRTGMLKDQVRGIFQLIYSLAGSGKDAQEICNALTVSLILLVRKMIQSRNQRRINDEAEKLTFAMAKRIRRYIDDSYGGELSVSEMARDLGISESYASHVFKDVYGLSPKQYLIECRLGEAQRLLQLTSASVNEVGEMAGFSSTSHFITIFQKYIGLSPAKYRRSLKDIDGPNR